jgi:hypothetical protein
LNDPQRHYLARFHARVDLAVGADGELVIHQFDGALHIAIHVQIFAAVNLAVAILTAFPMVADPPRDGSGSILPVGMLDMLDKVVASFLGSTGGADGAGLMVFVFKGHGRFFLPALLIPNAHDGGPPFWSMSAIMILLARSKWVGQRAPARPSPDYKPFTTP